MNASTQNDIEQKAEQIRDNLRYRGEQLRSGLEQADHRLREVCREYPIAALAGAVAAGFLVGRLLSKR